jgi:hypothetical protein
MRLYMDGEWFDAVPPGSTYEAEFESLIQDHAGSLFPGFLCARFDPLLITPLGNVQPDLILVDSDYRTWNIVEVELSTHSITRHVKPQIEKIQTARLDHTHADWLVARDPRFDRERLACLVRDVPHGTVLLANAPTPHWDDALSSLTGVQRAVVEVYRSRLNRTILRVNGSQPTTPGNIVTSLTPGKDWLASAYKVDISSSLPNGLSHIDIVIKESPVRHRVKVLGGEKYLFPTPTSTIADKSVRLVIDNSGLYRIEE